MMNNEQKMTEICEKIAFLYADAQDCVDSMKNSRAFKFAYYVSRLKAEFIQGNKSSRKEFLKWLSKKETHLSNRHFVMRLDQTLGSIKNELRQAIPYVDDFMQSGISADLLFKQYQLEKIERVISDYEGKKIIFFPEVCDWNIPLFQRPQQLAMAFADLDVLFFYVTPNYQDKIKGTSQVQKNCYLITPEYMVDTMKIAKKHDKSAIVEVYSTDNLHSLETINAWKEHCSGILYEYIDEISDEITGTVPEQTIARHKAFLKDKNVFVVATADKLYDEVVSVRGCDMNCLNSSNGVDIHHFTIEKNLQAVPDNIKSIIEKGKPIIGYFGAIANWFDFELIEQAALNRPQYEFLMIGPKYGTHDTTALKRLENIQNLHFVGTIDYKTLPYVAAYFSVATIPFVLNEITESTSPIKLFEYMAMGKPCVTTAMRECYKYPVVKVAENKQMFVELLDEGVRLAKYPEWVEKLKMTAEQNSWRQKAREILMLLES